MHLYQPTKYHSFWNRIFSFTFNLVFFIHYRRKSEKVKQNKNKLEKKMKLKKNMKTKQEVVDIIIILDYRGIKVTKITTSNFTLWNVNMEFRARRFERT